MSEEEHLLSGGGRAKARRFLLSVPATGLDMIEKALTIEADAVMIDLKDAVAPNEKAEARQNIVRSLKEQLRSERKVNRQWPEAFIRGILLEALLGEDLRFYPKMKYLSSVVKTALDHEGSAQILADVTNAIEGSEPLSDKTNRYDEVIEILENVQVTQDANGRPINSLIEAIEFVRNAGTAH